MQLTQEQRDKFRELTRPLVEWLKEVCPHPHVMIVLHTDSAELMEGVTGAFGTGITGRPQERSEGSDLAQSTL